MYQTELFAAITEIVVLCAHVKLGSVPHTRADDSAADAAAQRGCGLADDAEDGLEALASASALKNEGDAGEGTRAFHLPRRGSGARVLSILFEYGNGSH